MFKLMCLVGVLFTVGAAGIGCGGDPVTEWEKYCDAIAKCTGEGEADVASCKSESSTNESGCSNGGDIASCIDDCMAGGCANLKRCVAACPDCQR